MFSLRLLGGVSLVGPSGPLSGPAAQQRRLALLAVLAAFGDKGCSRDKLVGYFWPEREEPQARHLLANSVYVVRNALGEDAVLSSAEFLRLNPEIVSADVRAFDSATEQGELERAAELYGGPFMDGFYLSAAPEFDRWIELERRRLEGRYAELLEALAERAETERQFVTAAAWWQRLLAHDPVNTRVAGRLMLALGQAGDPGNALRVAEEHERRLSAELELEPDAEFRALVERMRNDAGRVAQPVGQAAAATPIPEADGAPGKPAADQFDTNAVDVEQGIRSRSGWTLGAAVAVVTLGIVAGLAAWYVGWGREAGTASEFTRVAVFPFSVPPDAEYADLDVGLMELLGSALDGAGELREVDPYSVLGQLGRSRTSGEVEIERARRIARELGATHFVLGRLLDLSETVRISASLYSLASDSMWRSDHAGKLQEIQALVDAVARDILVYTQPVRGEFLGSVSSASTTSYAALRAYLRGQAYMRRHHTDSARVEFQTAVEEDSMFALAWARLAEAGEFLGLQPDRWIPALERAHTLHFRLSARDRAWLAMYLAFTRGDCGAMERAARAMVVAYPDAAEAWRYLGDALSYPCAWQLGRHNAPEAETAYQRALELDPDSANLWVVNSMAIVAYYDGRKARGDSLWWRWSGRYWVPPEDSAGRERYFAVLEGRWFGSLVNRSWATCLYTDSLADARRIAARLTDPARPDSQLAVGHHLTAWLALAGGQWESAASHFAEANRLIAGVGVLERAWFSAFPFFELNSTSLRAIRDSLEQWSPPAAYRFWRGDRTRGWSIPLWLAPHAQTYTLGLLSARLGDADAAARYAEQLERANEPADSIGLLSDLALEVRAMSAMERGDWQAALSLLADAELRAKFGPPQIIALGFRPLGRFLRAEALMHLGRDQEAIGWYSTLGWLYDEFVFTAPARLRQGEVHERLGDPAEAVRHYRRFVARWRDADPEYQPLVNDVRARIARLTADVTDQ
jgi:DNA-binding SARP family transcriptional activator/Tfp pilus assembly protein PilF/TolB-like protein